MTSSRAFSWRRSRHTHRYFRLILPLYNERKNSQVFFHNCTCFIRVVPENNGRGPWTPSRPCCWLVEFLVRVCACACVLGVVWCMCVCESVHNRKWLSEEDNWRNIWIEFPENSRESHVAIDTVGCGWSVLRSHLMFTVTFVDHEGRKLGVGVDLGDEGHWGCESFFCHPK